MAATVKDIEGDFATVAETAAIMRVDPRTVRRYCADGTIPGVKIGDWKIPAEWLRKAAGGAR